jgi:AcrR family transcriptional regulator
VTQTADEAGARAEEAAKDEALGELEAVLGEEPAIDPLLDKEVQVTEAPLEEATVKGAPAHAPNDTRQRILDVALDLFTEQGYDGTSLRQISEQLGVTKAALYYHFESKEDILMALHMRIHEFGQKALVAMGDEPVTLELWGRLLDEIAGQMLGQRKLFLLHERNQAVLEKLHREDHDAEHEDIQNKLRQVLGDKRVALIDRVKMAAAVGVIFSSLFLADDSFDDVDTSELGSQLRRIIHNVLFG